MERFLEKVVRTLHEKHGKNISDLRFILPNRRAGLFLKKYIRETTGPNIFAPKILSIADFIEDVCPYQQADSITLLFELYQAVREVDGDAAEAFEKFSKWGKIMLADFNDVHSYLVPPEKLYASLRNIKTIENWSLNAEELTKSQDEFLTFWDQLGRYHDVFVGRLLRQEKCFQGYAYRWVAEHIEELLPDLKKQPLIFAGFNALSYAEQLIISSLVRAEAAEVFWDADAFYLDNPTHEAGHFLRQYRHKWDLPFEWVDRQLSTSQKQVHVIGVPGFAGQAKVAGDLLSDAAQTKDLRDCALVLGDESLLLPVLNALPDEVDKVNVTMGYPLGNTPMQSLFDAVFTMHENVGRMGREKHPDGFYHDDVLKLFHHPYIKRMMMLEGGRNVTNNISFHITEKNKIFVREEDLREMTETDEGLEKFNSIAFLFRPVRAIPDDLLELLNNLILRLREQLTTGEPQSLEMEYLFHYSKIVKRLHAMLEHFPFLKTLKSFRSIFQQIANGASLDFYGEPFRGLQLMGMLETRAIDFKHLILLSVNEDILPQGKSDHSLIPYDLRKHYKLPTYAERDAIYAYHFYRLLQRAENVWLIHNTQNDDFGSGERSRFIAQILHELPKANPNITITKQVLSTPIRYHDYKELMVPKDDMVLQKYSLLFESGFSPTALTTYINCPLDFYHKYILGLREANEVEVTVDISSFGTFIHQTLETLYEPHIGKPLAIADVEAMLPQISPLLEEQFRTLYHGEDMQYGKNLLIFKVACQFIERFLEGEKVFLEALAEAGESLTILGLEEEYKVPLEVTTPNGNLDVYLRGNVDRIDKVGDTIRIIDYKTGMAKPNELKIGELAAITQDKKFTKAFQVLMYALMYQQEHPDNKQTLQSGIISFRNLNQGVMNVRVNDSPDLTPEVLADFRKEISSLILRMIDNRTPLRHNPESSWCVFCEQV